MKAYFIQQTERASTLELREVPQPRRPAGRWLGREKAASLNRGEFIRGHGLTKPGAAKPAGTDGAGEVVGTGERVMGRLPAAFAEYALMDKPDAIPVPANLSWEDAAAVPITFLVVYDMLVQQGRLQANEWLLVTGVSAGVGVAALLAAKALGAKVIGTSGSAEKLEALKRQGLDVGIATRKPDFHDAVLKATDGKGANLVVNNVGGSVFAETIRCLAYEGRHATVGYVDRMLKGELDIETLHTKRLTLFGVSNRLRNAEQRAVTVRGFVADILPHIAAGRIKPVIDKVYPFAELPAAKARMESNAQVGKIVVRMPD